MAHITGKQAWRHTKAYKEWRTAGMMLYDNTCVVCGHESTHNHVHHKACAVYHPELKFDVDNCTVLCKSCHMHFHTTFKKSYRSKTTPEDLDDFIKLAKYFTTLSN